MDLEQCLDDEFSVNAHLFGLPDFEMAMQARESGVRRDSHVYRLRCQGVRSAFTLC